MLALQCLGAAAPHAGSSSALDAATSPEPSPSPSPSPLELCEQIWSKGVESLVPLADDPRPDIRGNQYLGKAPWPSLLFVHVGKTCGTTVGFTLRDNAGQIKLLNPPRPPYAEVHVHSVRPDVVEHAEHVLISLRDPVDRVVSAYNTFTCMRDPEHQNDPDICKRKVQKPQDLSLKQQSKRLRLIQCFPTVGEFADGLDDDTDCARLARESLLFDFSFGHSAMGACFYTGGLLPQLQNKSVYVVETDDCDEDLRAVPSWLGLNTSFHIEQRHEGTFPHHDDTISASGRARLRRHLEHEYAWVEQLRKLSWKRGGDGGHGGGPE